MEEQVTNKIDKQKVYKVLDWAIPIISLVVIILLLKYHQKITLEASYEYSQSYSLPKTFNLKLGFIYTLMGVIFALNISYKKLTLLIDVKKKLPIIVLAPIFWVFSIVTLFSFGSESEKLVKFYTETLNINTKYEMFIALVIMFTTILTVRIFVEDNDEYEDEFADVIEDKEDSELEDELSEELPEGELSVELPIENSHE